MFMPVGGKIMKVNPNLEDHPEIVNKDPYGEGWMVQIAIQDTSEIDQLLSASQYKDLINA
jgi:glycine cleavage system H protein